MGVGGLTPTLVDDDPTDCKVWSGGSDLPPPPLRKIKNPNSSLNRYKLMSDIIQTHPQSSFCNGL